MSGMSLGSKKGELALAAYETSKLAQPSDNRQTTYSKLLSDIH